MAIKEYISISNVKNCLENNDIWSLQQLIKISEEPSFHANEDDSQSCWSDSQNEFDKNLEENDPLEEPDSEILLVVGDEEEERSRTFDVESYHSPRTTNSDEVTDRFGTTPFINSRVQHRAGCPP